MREMNAEAVPRPEGVPDEQPVTAEALWCAHNTELMRFATVLVGPADAHDVVVDAFLRASEAILAGGIGNRRAYLFRSVYNGAAGRRRAQRRRAARELKALAPDTTPGDHPDIDVQRAVAELSVAQRAVVYLAYWSDLSERDIAAELGVSLGTVHRHLVRARIHLRKALQ